jgi:hypothetical protein
MRVKISDISEHELFELFNHPEKLKNENSNWLRHVDGRLKLIIIMTDPILHLFHNLSV